MSLPLLIALLLLLGWLCQWLAWRTRQPAIVYLLILGIVLGPLTGWLDPDALFGDLLFHLVSLGVAIILFEGSLSLQLSEAKGVSRIIRNLITVGVLITWSVMAIAAHYLAGLDWSIALLFGAIMSVTGPTVIIPMLRAIQPTTRISSILRWEGILVDPIGALLAVLVYEAIISGQQTHSVYMFFLIVLAGGGSGLLGALLVNVMLKRAWVPDYLQNFFILSIVLLCFTGANALAEESGLLSVTVLGMLLANQRHLVLDRIIDFKEHLSLLIISMLFILLAARMDMKLMITLWPVCLGILMVAQLIARPLSVLISSIGTSVNFREGMLLAWVAPRGIVAAAVSALFAMRLGEAGNEQALALVPLSFAVILGTVLIQGATSRRIASALELSSGDQEAVLIVGVDSVSLAIGEALAKQDIQVQFADERRFAVNEARMAGFTVWYGNVLSDRAEHQLDLVGVKHLFIVSRSAETSALVSTHYRPEFGMSNIYTITQEANGGQSRLSRSLRVLSIGSGELSWSKFASLLSKGWKVKATRLTESFSYQHYCEKWGSSAHILFALTPQRKLKVFTDSAHVTSQADWVIMALVNPDAVDEKMEIKFASEKDNGIGDQPAPA